MYAYLTLLFKICLFRKGPQDIPHSQQLLRLSTIAYVLVSYLVIQISAEGLRIPLQIAAELLITFGFAALILGLAGKFQRFTQTTTTFLSTDALISIFAMPIIATLNLDASNILAIFAMLALMIWNWLITAHIIRHALDKSFSFALGIALLYVFSASQIMGLLFPPINPAT